MQATLESRFSESGRSLLVDYHEGAPNCALHYQPEMELVLIRGCMGKRLVGDVVSDFKDYDLVLLGPHLPHMWQTMTVDRNCDKAYGVVVHFSKESLGLELLAKPEFRPVNAMLDESYHGLSFDEGVKSRVEPLLDDMLSGDDMLQLIRFIDVLRILSSSVPTAITKRRYDSDSVTRDQKLYGSVLEFIQKNHRDPIAVGEVARHTCMSVSGFCRFFKRVSGETFVTFLNRWRVDRACLLLEETDMPITQVCFEVGYANVSHFNRQFRRYKGMSPREYRSGNDGGMI